MSIEYVLESPKFAARLLAKGLEIAEVKPPTYDDDNAYTTVLVKVLEIPGDPVACDFAVGEFHGCCGIKIVNNLTVPAYIPGQRYPYDIRTRSPRNRGIGGILLDAIVQDYRDAADNGDASGLLLAAISNEENHIAAKALVRRRRWRAMKRFINPITGHTVTLWGKDVTMREPAKPTIDLPIPDQRIGVLSV
jgi:hypothetical protein